MDVLVTPAPPDLLPNFFTGSDSKPPRVASPEPVSLGIEPAGYIPPPPKAAGAKTAKKPPLRTARRPLFQFTEPDPADLEDRADDAWSLPSWLLSFSLHVVLIVLVGSTFLRGSGNPFGGRGDGAGIGDIEGGGAIEATFGTITVGGGGGDPESEEPETRGAGHAGAGRDEGLSQAGPEIDVPPVELPTAPVGAAPGVGAGPLGREFEGGGGARVRGTGGGEGGGRAGGIAGQGGGGSGPGRGPGNGSGDGKAGFFGIRDKTSRVVYVIDRSMSMGNHNALAVAKSELMQNLEALDGDQVFQIVFFHEAITEMKVDRDRKANLYPANDNNRTLAQQFLDSIHADMGTRRFPALKRALELNPEVIFFLSDVEDEMPMRELDQIQKQAAKQKTRIHVIEFGKGADLTNDNNFLKRLARANGGRYLYRDVLQFGSK